MTGGTLIGIILLSMAWLFGIGGLLVNLQAWRALRRARPDESVPSGIPFLPGVVLSLAVFLTLPQLHRHAGIEVPWPFLWILLPLVLDLQGLGGILAAYLLPAAPAEGLAREAPAAADGEVTAAPHGAEAQVRNERADAAIGCLLGTAVGDALGLPCEGLSRRRLARWYGAPERYRLVLGHGMCSDDTDHACMVAQSIAASGGHPRRFSSNLAWRLRFWLLGLPAGVGLATLRSILKLWLFVPPQVSGVRSAGNGPAMRSALLGVCFADSDATLVMHVAASTVITHRDPRAECGALAVALAARASMKHVAPGAYLAELRRFAAPFGAAGAELLALAERAADSASRGEATEAYAASIGCADAVSGYMYHSVPVVLHAWFRHPDDLPAALRAVIGCGGDTDTTAAILGGIVGARVGRAGIPERWLETLWDWPRGTAWIEAAAARAAAAARDGVRRTQAHTPSPFKQLARNLFFLAVVLVHGFRRLAPPY